MIPQNRRRGFLGIERISASLSFKVLASSGLVVLAISGFFWYRSLQVETNHLMSMTVDYGDAFAEIVRKSVRGGMLHNDREEIARNIASIASSETVRAVKIYNSRGLVTYSSEPREIGLQVDSNEVTCLGCHHDPLHPRETLFEDKRYIISRAADGSRNLCYVEPIYNEPDCTAAACHAHAAGKKVLGILLSTFSLTRLDQRVAKQTRDFSVFILLYIFSLASVSYFLLWRLVLRPVHLLSLGMDRVSTGDLSQKVPVPSGDEIGRLAASFNAMTEELNAARQDTENWAENMEDQIVKKTVEIRRTQVKLAEAEKFAALGHLSAEIAHEIRNPLTALGGYGRRLQRLVSSPQKKHYAEIVVAEVSRLERILKDILDFSRPARVAFRRDSITGILRDSLAAFGERCAEHGIRIETAFNGDLPVLIDPDQIRRAVDNLVANAIDVMKAGGTLWVGTGIEEISSLKFIVVEIADTGPGIAEENLTRVFEPFFTSKKMGHGTGLGLSITRKIIEAHGSFIRVANRPGGGLLVKVYFPSHTEEDAGHIPCWQYMPCGRTGPDSPEPCPAYPHFGRICWVVAGTLCEGKIQGDFAKKHGDCRTCEFFQKVTAGEI